MSWDIPATLKDFRRRHPEKAEIVNGRKWGVIEVGRRGKSRPTLVLLPGTLGTAEIFWKQITALKGRAHIIALSYPACADARRLAGDVVTLVKRRRGDGFHLLGTSLGGLVVQLVAGMAPQRIDGLIIANTFVVRPEMPPRSPWGMLRGGAATADARAAMIAQIETWPAGDAAFRELRAVVAVQARHRIATKILRGRLLAGVSGPARVPRIKVADTRIDIIDCGDDPLMPPEVREAVAQRYPGAKRHSFKRGGHYPYITRHQRYTRIIAARLGIG